MTDSVGMKTDTWLDIWHTYYHGGQDEGTTNDSTTHDDSGSGSVGLAHTVDVADSLTLSTWLLTDIPELDYTDSTTER